MDPGHPDVGESGDLVAEGFGGHGGFGGDREVARAGGDDTDRERRILGWWALRQQARARELVVTKAIDPR